MAKRYRVLSHGIFHSSHDSIEDGREVAKKLCIAYLNRVKIYDDSPLALKRFGIIETWSNFEAWKRHEEEGRKNG
jgi:hypothetical protein